MGSEQFNLSLVAIATGVISAGWTSGKFIPAVARHRITVLIGVPTALATPQCSPTVWHGLFTRGMALIPKVAASTALCCLYGAYTLRGGRRSMIYLAVAGLVVSIIPFTVVFMRPTNELLLTLFRDRPVTTSVEAAKLIAKRGKLNMVRSLFPFAASILGLWGIFHHWLAAI
ncbi:hypothetical protein LLEC1_07644 [Akanthomyces lecanii]|uniref:DUF1772 domain-containing protein n=1 Tax=Cordyceps confragosa TaxID=2714763 RepID=A0A179IAX6_CORDF|nr:hypothetical protein LLEC1_07644 [Akanthomyces lecanii]